LKLLYTRLAVGCFEARQQPSGCPTPTPRRKPPAIRSLIPWVIKVSPSHEDQSWVSRILEENTSRGGSCGYPRDAWTTPRIDCKTIPPVIVNNPRHLQPCVFGEISGQPLDRCLAPVLNMPNLMDLGSTEEVSGSSQLGSASALPPPASLPLNCGHKPPGRDMSSPERASLPEDATLITSAAFQPRKRKGIPLVLCCHCPYLKEVHHVPVCG